MQSIFILALFGILYSTVTVIITMLSTTAMQQKLERIEFVEQLFQDIEVGVKKGYLGNNSDFLNLGVSPSAMGARYAIDGSLGPNAARRIDNFLPQYVSYTNDQLLVDPWGEPYIIEINYKNIIIYADNEGGANEIQAPIAVFLLYSSGPDKAFGVANPSNNYDEMRRFAAPDNINGEDDIVHVFTTLEVSQEMWNHTKETFDKMISAVSYNYEQQYNLFSPTIQSNYYDVVDFYDGSFNWIGDDNAPGCGTPLLHAWKNDKCIVPGVAGGNLTGRSGFPVMHPNDGSTSFEMMENLGIDMEYKRMIPGLLSDLSLTLSSDGNGHLDQMRFTITESAGSQWDINYTKMLEGEKIISGL